MRYARWITKEGGTQILLFGVSSHPTMQPFFIKGRLFNGLPLFLYIFYWSRFKVEMLNFVHENKKGNAPTCNLWLITIAENYTDKRAQKSFHNKVWKDIKVKSERKSNSIFLDLEKLAASIQTVREDSDDW